MSIVRYIAITTKTGNPANIFSPFALIEHCCGFGVKWQGHIYNICTKYSASERKIRRQMSAKAVETKMLYGCHPDSAVSECIYYVFCDK